MTMNDNDVGKNLGSIAFFSSTELLWAEEVELFFDLVAGGCE